MATRSSAKPNSSYAWLIWVVIYISSFMAPMNMFKVPPVASWLIPEFGMDPVLFGWLMSAISIIGFIFAFPTVFIVRKLGLKGTTLLALATMVVGGLIGVLSSNLELLFAGRFLEGVGIGLIGVSAPAAISVWFTEDKRGLPLGAWATWFPLGTIIVFNIAPYIAEALGWRSIWWICIIVSAISFLLFLLVFKLPNTETEEEVVITASPRECLAVLNNKNIWLLGIVFFCFSFIINGVINTFYNQYLGDVWLMDPGIASTLTSVITLFALVMQPVLGFLYDKTGKRKPFLIVAMILMAAGMVFAFIGVGNLAILWTFIILMGLGCAMAGASARPIAPEVMPSTALGATMGMVVLQLFQNGASAAGSPIFGAVLASSGWVAAGFALCLPVLIIGAIIGFFIKSR